MSRLSTGVRAALRRARARRHRRPTEASGRYPRSSLNYNEEDVCGPVRRGPGDCRLDWRTDCPWRDRRTGHFRGRVAPPGARRPDAVWRDLRRRAPPIRSGELRLRRADSRHAGRPRGARPTPAPILAPRRHRRPDAGRVDVLGHGPVEPHRGRPAADRRRRRAVEPPVRRPAPRRVRTLAWPVDFDPAGADPRGVGVDVV
jgi:hypothetical protein